MSTWLHALVVSGITAAACGQLGLDDEAAHDHEPPAHSERSQRPRDAGVSVLDAAAGSTFDASLGAPLGPAPVGEPDAEAASDLDAGFPDLLDPVVRDCSETLRCNADWPAPLQDCVEASTRALARATPEARERFLTIVMRCSSERGCDYVRCATQP